MVHASAASYNEGVTLNYAICGGLLAMATFHHRSGSYTSTTMPSSISLGPGDKVVS